MKLIVIDPRHVGLASKADLWLRVRPGTDGALALGLAHLVISRGWYDREFVRTWTNAPHLVRTDTGRLLRAVDLAAGGERRSFRRLEPSGGQPVAYDPPTGRYGAPVGASRARGRVAVATTQGMVALPARCSRTMPNFARGIRPSAWRRLLDCARPGGGGGAAALAVAAGFLLRVERARASRQHHRDGPRDGAALRADRFIRRRAATCCSRVPTPAITGEDLPARARHQPRVAENVHSGRRSGTTSIARFLSGRPGERSLSRSRGLVGFGSNLLLLADHCAGGVRWQRLISTSMPTCS